MGILKRFKQGFDLTPDELKETGENEMKRLRAIDRINNGYSPGSGLSGERDEQKKRQVRNIISRLLDGLKIILNN
jgi:hypothetical protein